MTDDACPFDQALDREELLEYLMYHQGVRKSERLHSPMPGHLMYSASLNCVQKSGTRYEMSSRPRISMIRTRKNGGFGEF
jgi:hypothetical protein